MAAGSRLPIGPVVDFFSFLHLFKHTFCTNFKQAVGPGVLQTFSTCAVKPLINKMILYKISHILLSEDEDKSTGASTECHSGPALANFFFGPTLS